MALETSQKQMKLRSTPDFLQRLEYIMVTQASVVLAESNGTANHTERTNYAKLVLNFPTEYAQKASTLVSGGINVTSATTATPNDDTGVATFTTTDAALLSQVATLWNTLAGVVLNP